MPTPSLPEKLAYISFPSTRRQVNFFPCPACAIFSTGASGAISIASDLGARARSLDVLLYQTVRTMSTFLSASLAEGFNLEPLFLISIERSGLRCLRMLVPSTISPLAPLNRRSASLMPSFKPSLRALSHRTSFAPADMKRPVSLPGELSLTIENVPSMASHAPQSLCTGQDPLCRTVTLSADHPFRAFSNASTTLVFPTPLCAPDTVIIFIDSPFPYIAA